MSTRLTQRQAVIGVFSLLCAGAGVVLITSLLSSNTFYVVVTGVGLLVFGSLLAAYWRGWDPARYVGLAILTPMIGLVMPEPFVTEVMPALLALVPVIALLLADLYWVFGSSVLLILILLARAGGVGIYTQPIALVTFAMIVGGMIIARLVTDTAQLSAEDQARRAEEALARSEAQASELAQKASELEHQNDEQRRLIELVALLETPVIALAEGVLLAPVVGHLDSRRAALLTERLLHEVSATRARLVILDIAGVAAVDTGVAHALLRAVQAVKLLGCDVTITGISATVAATITQLGINLSVVRTARTPQEALASRVVSTPVPPADGVRRN